jgi:hypothetical protein
VVASRRHGFVWWTEAALTLESPMSSRERWIIYPLLFFAFCLAARDQFPYLRPEVVDIPHLSCRVVEADRIEAEWMVATKLRADYIDGQKEIVGELLEINVVDTGELVCNGLLVKSTKGQRVAELGSANDGGARLALCNVDERETILLAAQQEEGQADPDRANALRLVIRATQAGGEIYVIDAEKNVVEKFSLPSTGSPPEEATDDRSEAKSATERDEP